MGAAAGVGADQHTATAVLGKLGQGQSGGVDVVGGGVGPGIARAQHDGQWFTGSAGAVVGEGRHRVKAEGLLPGWCGLLFVGVGDDDGGVDVQRDQFALCAGRIMPGQGPGPLTGGGTGYADGLQRPHRVGGQSVDQPRDGGIGGHGAEQLGLSAQHRDVGQAVPAQRQSDSQISDDLAGIVDRPRRPPPLQPIR